MSSIKTALIQVSDREGEGDKRGDIRRGGIRMHTKLATFSIYISEYDRVSMYTETS